MGKVERGGCGEAALRNVNEGRGGGGGGLEIRGRVRRGGTMD